MTRTYSLLVEGDESGYSAHVPELPSISRSPDTQSRN